MWPRNPLTWAPIRFKFFKVHRSISPLTQELLWRAAANREWYSSPAAPLGSDCGSPCCWPGTNGSVTMVNALICRNSKSTVTYFRTFWNWLTAEVCAKSSVIVLLWYVLDVYLLRNTGFACLVVRIYNVNLIYSSCWTQMLFNPHTLVYYHVKAQFPGYGSARIPLARRGS